MTKRFADLKKIHQAPAAKLLAEANTKLETKLDLPASASVEKVLIALEEADAGLDMIKLLSFALPPREGAWWACLAARDIIGEDQERTNCMATAEAWVFKPSDETREAARHAAEIADADDETNLCAVAVAMCDGKLGVGEMQNYDAPPGASGMAVYGQCMLALGHAGDDFEDHAQFLIERALDIARGGSGKVEPPPPRPKPEPEPIPDEDDEEDPDIDADDTNG